MSIANAAYRLLKHINPSPWGFLAPDNGGSTKGGVGLRVRAFLLSCVAVLSLTSCYYIDDRPDSTIASGVNYQLRIVSNITTQVNNQLGGDSDGVVSDFLINQVTTKMQPAESNAHLFFYPKEGARISFERTIQGTSSTFSLELPTQDYRHLSAVGASPTVLLKDTDDASAFHFEQIAGDTIDGHELPVFSGRLDMTVTGNEDHDYEVNLYPADADVAVLVTKQGTFKDVKVYLTDLANGFNINDSTYTFTSNPLIRTAAQVIPGTAVTAFTATVFPSRDSAPGTIDPDVSAASGAIWRVIVMATLPDNSITRTVLYVRKPLHAGELRILRVVITENGAVEVSTPDVGASVTLDWKKGGTYEPEI